MYQFVRIFKISMEGSYGIEINREPVKNITKNNTQLKRYIGRILEIFDACMKYKKFYKFIKNTIKKMKVLLIRLMMLVGKRYISGFYTYL